MMKEPAPAPLTPPRKAPSSGTPLPAKLGIKDGSRVLVLDCPGITEISRLPEASASEPVDVIVFFTTRLGTLAGRFEKLKERLARRGALWVAWPKKGSRLKSELELADVQGIGEAAGLVENKSSSIDSDWQALRFVQRVKDRPRDS